MSSPTNNNYIYDGYDNDIILHSPIYNQVNMCDTPFPEMVGWDGDAPSKLFTTFDERDILSHNISCHTQDGNATPRMLNIIRSASDNSELSSNDSD